MSIYIYLLLLLDCSPASIVPGCAPVLVAGIVVGPVGLPHFGDSPLAPVDEVLCSSFGPLQIFLSSLCYWSVKSRMMLTLWKGVEGRFCHCWRCVPEAYFQRSPFGSCRLCQFSDSWLHTWHPPSVLEPKGVKEVSRDGLSSLAWHSWSAFMQPDEAISNNAPLPWITLYHLPALFWWFPPYPSC